jgi:hypothetical protein
MWHMGMGIVKIPYIETNTLKGFKERSKHEMFFKTIYSQVGLYACGNRGKPLHGININIFKNSNNETNMGIL